MVLAFFFLLRVGEYTASREVRRTVPLRRADVRLWAQGAVIPHTAPLDTLLQADAITICLENQKNGHKGATLHHTASLTAGFCPVEAAARLMHSICHLPPATSLGTYVDEAGRAQRVTSDEVRAAIRIAASGDGLPQHGYDLRRVGSHSLRSGGAVHLALAGYDSTTIKKLGRWSSDTYLTYIQSQVGNLFEGVTMRMAVSLRFHMVAGAGT